MPKKLRKINGSMLSREAVLELARQAERTTLKAPEHPLIGGLDDIDLVNLPAAPHSVQRARAPLSTYCESCGHVDSHASGCPQANADAMLEELDEEEALETMTAVQNAPEPILPLIRRIGASLLRRFAQTIDPARD